MVFNAPLPAEARPDLSIDGNIQISKLTNTLYVNRPTFAQSQSRAVLYKLTQDGTKAHKVTVNFGVGSAAQIQVLAGLNTGDKVILSDHSAFEHIETIAIK